MSGHLTFEDTAETVSLLHSAHAGGEGSAPRHRLLVQLERIGCISEADMIALLEARGASTVVLVAAAEDGEAERACGQCGDECRCGGDPTAPQCQPEAEQYPTECEGFALTDGACGECFKVCYDTVGGMCPNIL